VPQRWVSTEWLSPLNCKKKIIIIIIIITKQTNRLIYISPSINLFIEITRANKTKSTLGWILMFGLSQGEREIGIARIQNQCPFQLITLFVYFLSLYSPFFLLSHIKHFINIIFLFFFLLLLFEFAITPSFSSLKKRDFVTLKHI